MANNLPSGIFPWKWKFKCIIPTRLNIRFKPSKKYVKYFSCCETLWNRIILNMILVKLTYLHTHVLWLHCKHLHKVHIFLHFETIELSDLHRNPHYPDNQEVYCSQTYRMNKFSRFWKIKGYFFTSTYWLLKVAQQVLHGQLLYSKLLFIYINH